MVKEAIRIRQAMWNRHRCGNWKRADSFNHSEMTSPRRDAFLVDSARCQALSREQGRGAESAAYLFSTKGASLSDLLHAAMRNPDLYEETGRLFWCDPDMAPQLLEAHLDADNPMASRPPRFVDASTKWIASIAPADRYPRVCDLGCGPGLYAERLAKMGYRVTGIDVSTTAIEHARASAAREGLEIDYVVSDYTSLQSGYSADLALMAYCDYGALSSGSRRALMGNVKKLLRPGGIFVLDVFSDRHYAAAREIRSWDAASSGGLWSPEPYVCLHERKKHGGRVLLDRYIVQTSRTVKAYNVWTTCYVPESLRFEAVDAGFSVLSIAGSIAGDDFDPTGDTLCAVLENSKQ